MSLDKNFPFSSILGLFCCWTSVGIKNVPVLCTAISYTTAPCNFVVYWLDCNFLIAFLPGHITKIYFKGFYPTTAAAAAAKLLQSCPTLRPHRRQPTRLPHPWDSPGNNTGVGCHFLSNAWRWKVKVKSLSRVWLLATPWTAAYQAPLSVGCSRQENWSGVPLPSPTPLLVVGWCVPRTVQNLKDTKMDKSKLAQGYHRVLSESIVYLHNFIC